MHDPCLDLIYQDISSFVGLESLLESGVLDDETKYDVLLTEVVEHSMYNLPINLLVFHSYLRST